METQKHCPECGDRITGREDKRFCSDCCRSAFNNKHNKNRNNCMRSVNSRLRRNHRILTELNAGGITRIRREQLLSKGFDFEFFTNVRPHRSGITYHFIYDQGYRPVDLNNYLLIKND